MIFDRFYFYDKRNAKKFLFVDIIISFLDLKKNILIKIDWI